MARVRNLKKGLKAVEDLELLKLLKSEINFELSSNPLQNVESGSLGDFVVDYDSAKSKDVVLRRKLDSGEVVAVSALLGPPNYEKDLNFARDVFMKVCVKKPSFNPILQFDCKVYEDTNKGSEFNINKANYLASPSCLSPSIYKGPSSFSELDPQLQDALKNYLISKGIGTSLTNFLLHHLHKREQQQYLNWLKKGEAFLVENKQLSQSSEADSA